MSSQLKRLKRAREEAERPEQVAGVCHYWVKKKRRYCKLVVCANDNKFCVNHTVADHPDNGKRVPCPLDPNHSVYEGKMKKHLLRCNKTKLKRRLEAQPYFAQNLNTQVVDESEKVVLKLDDFSESELDALVARIEQVVRTLLDQSKVKIVQLNETLLPPCRKFTSDKQEKHHKQQEAILNHIQHFGLKQDGFEDHTCFVEMGASKGGLSVALNNRISNLDNCTNILIDRAAVKAKKDRKENFENEKWERVRIDIRHLDLSKIDKVKAAEHVVVLSKHLCGAATCFSLRCCCSGNLTTRPELICIALCCHHVCDFNAYPNPSYLEEHKVTAREFQALKLMSSWANCGWNQSKDKSNGKASESTPQFAGTTKRKQEIGFRCKRFFDFGRVLYLEDQGYNASLYQYVPSDISPENLLVLATRKKADKSSS